MRNLIIGILFGLMAPLTLWANNNSESASSTSSLGESSTSCHEIADVARGSGEPSVRTDSEDSQAPSRATQPGN